MDKELDITFLTCCLYIISELAPRPEHIEMRGELEKLKAGTIAKLLRLKQAKRLGLHTGPHQPELIVVYTVDLPELDESFYFFLPPTDVEYHILPKVEGYFRNPNPKYVPSLDNACEYLKAFILGRSLIPLKKKKVMKKILKRGPKLKRSIFVSNYLDG
jgi:hypothetical protein